jgi:hypothetical protein
LPGRRDLTTEKETGGMRGHSACFLWATESVLFFLCNILFHGIMEKCIFRPPMTTDFSVAQSLHIVQMLLAQRPSNPGGPSKKINAIMTQ